MRYTATFVKLMSRKKWHPGTALYQLDEAASVVARGFLTSTCYVIVAVSPAAVGERDEFGFRHYHIETTIFAANKNGSLFGGFWDRDAEDEEDHTWVPKLGLDSGAEFEHCRVRGKYDHGAALEKLGYAQLPLPPEAAQAIEEASKKAKSSPRPPSPVVSSSSHFFNLF